MMQTQRLRSELVRACAPSLFSIQDRGIGCGGTHGKASGGIGQSPLPGGATEQDTKCLDGGVATPARWAYARAINTVYCSLVLVALARVPGSGRRAGSAGRGRGTEHGAGEAGP